MKNLFRAATLAIFVLSSLLVFPCDTRAQPAKGLTPAVTSSEEATPATTELKLALHRVSEVDRDLSSLSQVQIGDPARDRFPLVRLRGGDRPMSPSFVTTRAAPKVAFNFYRHVQPSWMVEMIEVRRE